MAEQRTPQEIAGDRLYRNSLDEILDQIQREQAQQELVLQRRNNAISSDPDPVKKLNEIQGIEKKVINESPEVKNAVLNKVYNFKPGVTAMSKEITKDFKGTKPKQLFKLQPQQQPQYTMGAPRGQLKNLDNEQIEFYSELAKIQKPFDEVFQEKLKTAQAVPGRNVMDPMSGGSYPIPGLSKEEVATQQTIKELENRGVLNPSLSRDIGNFLTSIIPLGGMTPGEQAESTFYPARTALAQIPGTIIGLGTTGSLIKGPKIAQKGADLFTRGNRLGNLLQGTGISTVKAQKFGAGALASGSTFGAYSLVNQIDENTSIANKTKTIVEDAILGTAFGVTGSLNNPLARALTEGAVGVVEAKLVQGASNQEALLNGLIFVGFGALNKRDVSRVEKGLAIKEFGKVSDDAVQIMQEMRANAGLKPYTKKQVSDWKKSINKYADRFKYEKYDANKIKADTEEFISRFLNSNDPKGSIALIKKLGDQTTTQRFQAKAKTKKESVTVPETGKADVPTKENVLKLSTGQQLDRMKDLGFTEDQFVRLSGAERMEILDNSIKAQNYLDKQLTRPSMPGPETAPDDTPSVTKPDKLDPEKLKPKKEKVNNEWKIPEKEFKKYKNKATKDDFDNVLKNLLKGGTFSAKEVAEKIKNNFNPSDETAKEIYNLLIRSDKFIKDTRAYLGKNRYSEYGEIKLVSKAQIKKQEEAELKAQKKSEERLKKDPKYITRQKREKEAELKAKTPQEDLELELKTKPDQTKKLRNFKTYNEFINSINKLKSGGLAKQIDNHKVRLVNSIDKNILPKIWDRIKEAKSKNNNNKDPLGNLYSNILIGRLQTRIAVLSKTKYWLEKGKKNFDQKRLDNELKTLDNLLKGDVNSPRSIFNGKIEKKEPGVAQTELDAKGLTTIQTNPKSVKIDESKFQPREEYNQAVIDDIAENFNPAKWEEPVVWEDPKTGDYIVVSGHHRHLGVKKGGFTGATYKVLPKGTTLDEAINISEEGNLARTVQTDFENANVVRRRLDNKQSITQIVKDLPGLTKAKTTAGKTNALRNLVNLTYLDKKGKFKEQYENVNEYPRIKSTSSYIGSLRKQYDWMSNKYEDDIFTYLYTEVGIKKDDADWKLNLENTLDKLADFKKEDRPGSILKQLRKEPLKPKEGTDSSIIDEINSLKKSIDNITNNLADSRYLQKEVDKIKGDENDSAKLQTLTNKLRQERVALKKELRSLIEETNKPDPDQEALFAPIDQFNMFGGSDMLPDIKKSDKAKLQNLVAELTQVNKEQRLLDNQVSQGILTKLKARSQFKELEKRQNDLVKAIHKIEKPINGSKYTPGLLFDYNKQFELNLAGKKQTDLFRKNATETQKENAKELKALVSRRRKERKLPSVRASAIETQLEKFGASHFIGKRVRNQEELADLVQVARDPRFETLRYYFVDDKGKIVGYSAISNKMPGWVNPYTIPGAKRDFPYPEQGVSGKQQLAWWISSLMKNHKASGFYIQHNHPSGASTPSAGDIAFTKFIAETFEDDFKGHVVIDFNEYSTINIKEKYRKEFKNKTMGKKALAYTMPRDLLETSYHPIPGLSEKDRSYTDYKNSKGKVIAQIKKIGVSPYREGYMYLRKNPDNTYRIAKFVKKGEGKILYSVGDKKFSSEKSALEEAQKLYIVSKGKDPLRKISEFPVGRKTEEKMPIFYNGAKIKNMDKLVDYAKSIIKENHVTLVPLTMDMRVNGIIDIPLKPFLDAQKNKMAMLRLKAQVRKVAQNFGGQRMWAVANISSGVDADVGNRVDMFSHLDATLKTLKKDSFINDAIRTHVVDMPSGKKSDILIDQLYPDRTENLEGHLEFKTKPGKVTSQPSKIVGEVDTSYRISWHTAPKPQEDYKNSGDNVEDVYPDDVYGPMGAQYYGTRGHRDPMDNKTLSIMRGLRGKPDKEVTIYRAVPKKIKDINPGDWVTINRDYAVEHGKGPLGDKYEIISKTVKAKEIFTAGDSIHEWGYHPSAKDLEGPGIISDQLPSFKIKPYAKTRKEGKAQRKVDPKIYERVVVKKPFKLFKERKEQIKSPGFSSLFFVPLSTRLRVINPVLKRSIRRFQANVDLNTARDLEIAQNFMKSTDKLRRKNKKDYAILDLAMKNSDVEMVENIINKHNMNDDYQDVKLLLDDLYTRAEMVGYEPNYISNYFPRRIEDSDGLLKYLETSDSWGIVQGAIKEKEKEIGRRLEKDERVKLINSLIRGFGGRIVVQKPANLKEREIEYLTPEINEFYYDSNTALHTYINRMNEAIEIKRFFGKGMGPTDPTIQIDNNVIGEYVDDLVEKGLVKTNQQDELINLLRVRFATGPMDHRVARARNLAYLSTMGQLTSAITQIGDFAWSIYSGGLTETGKALGQSIIRKSKITRQDIGVEKIAEEFTDVRKTAKILDNVFTLTGLKYIDSLGKESLINSTINKYRKEAAKGKFSSSRKDRIEEAFSKEELPKVINDLLSGKVTDDIKYLAHYTLSDFQPVSLTEMPEFYLKAPNGRVMYMLKTYTLKQFDILRNEAFKKMNEGKKVEGFKRLMYLTGILMLTGMSSDKIKEFVTGRESTFDELIGDNLLRLFGLSKYLIWYYRRYDSLGFTFAKALLPPVGILNPVFESFMRDLNTIYKKTKKDEEWKIQDLDSPKNIPIFGKFYYNYFGRGLKFNKERKEKKKKKSSKKLKRPSFADF